MWLVGYISGMFRVNGPVTVSWFQILKVFKGNNNSGKQPSIKRSFILTFTQIVCCHHVYAHWFCWWAVLACFSIKLIAYLDFIDFFRSQIVYARQKKLFRFFFFAKISVFTFPFIIWIWHWLQWSSVQTFILYINLLQTNIKVSKWSKREGTMAVAKGRGMGSTKNCI